MKGKTMEIKPVTHVTVTDQVMAQLGDLILTGQLKPGDKLPNERTLSTMFGTTRARIREVLRSLVLIGLIETRMGDGSYVSATNTIPHEAIGLMFFRERSKYDELYKARKVLEPPVFVLAAELITPAQIQRLEDIVANCEQSLAHGGPPEDFLEMISEYDAIIVDATGNSILIALMAIFRNMSHDAYLTLLRVPDAARNSIKHRKKIVEAIKSGNRDRVRRAVVAHMESAKSIYGSKESVKT